MYAARQIRAKRRFSRSSDHKIAIWCQFPCTLRQCTGREVDRDAGVDAEVGVDAVWRRGGGCCCIPGGVGAGEGGAGAPCVFQRLRLGGKALDGELARLVPRGGPNQRSDRRRHPAEGPRLPSRSTFAESRNPPPHHLPPSHLLRIRTTIPLNTSSALAPPPPRPPSARSMSADSRICSQTAPETRSVSAGG